MLFNTFLLVTLTNFLIGAVGGSPVSGTNAQRLARGLPPNPPVQFARRLASTWPTKRTVDSNCHAGKIEVREESDGHILGFVGNWQSGISGINFVGDPLKVKVCKAGVQGDRYDINATNPAFKPPFFVGANSGPVAKTLRTGDRSSVGFGNVPRTPPNALPTLVDGNYYESAIWAFNSSTGELSPQWINPDNSKPNTVIAYDIRANGLFFAGDISQWNVSGSFASAVHFFLV